MSGRRTLVRCTQNKYKTPLFSYDEKGIYVKCKDCRIPSTKTSEQKRGTYHLVPWSYVMGLLNQSSTLVDSFECDDTERLVKAVIIPQLAEIGESDGINETFESQLSVEH